MLTLPLPSFTDDIQKGLRPKRNVRQAMAHDLSQYAIVQKEGCVSALSAFSVHTFAFFIAHAFAPPPLAAWAWTSASRRPRRAWRGTRCELCATRPTVCVLRLTPRPRFAVKVTPNMLIVPPELLLYIATSSEEKYVYNVAGPAGPAKFEEGVAGYESRAFRGCGVVTSTPFEISDDADSLQMLQRNTQVGEFYRMRAPSIKWTGADKDKANYMVCCPLLALSSCIALTRPAHRELNTGHRHLQRGLGHARAHLLRGGARGVVHLRGWQAEPVQGREGRRDQQGDAHQEQQGW